MARIERLITVCDLDKCEAQGRRVLFTLRGRIYEVDACEPHAAELLSAAGLVERARAAAILAAARRAQDAPDVPQCGRKCRPGLKT